MPKPFYSSIITFQLLCSGSSNLQQIIALLSLKPDKFADTEEIKNMLEEVLFNRNMIPEVRIITHK